MKKTQLTAHMPAVCHAVSARSARGISLREFMLRENCSGRRKEEGAQQKCSGTAYEQMRDARRPRRNSVAHGGHVRSQLRLLHQSLNLSLVG